MKRWLLLLFAVIAPSISEVAKAGEVNLVSVVHPSGGEIPANALRISLEFSASPNPFSLDDIHLEREDGSLVAGAFLDEELWSPDGRILTLLFHPGRVKSGLIANERLGRALEEGKIIRLFLQGHEIKSWIIVAPVTSAPDPQHWKIGAPRSRTYEPLNIALDAPLDAQAVNMIAIESPVGTRLQGRAALRTGETSWVFQPSIPWSNGVYQVRIHPSLEDVAGNRMAGPFEHRSSQLRRETELSLAFSPHE